MGSSVTTEQAARAAGWHIWAGKTVGGGDGEAVLCPVHARGTRMKPPAMEGEVPLW